MIRIIEKHLTSPNNVLSEVKRELENNGFCIPKGLKGILNINGKLYSLTTTSYKLDYPDARQYDASLQGLVTLWLRDGNFYIFDKHLLKIGTITREFKNSNSTQIIPKVNFKDNYLLDNMRILSTDVYKNIVQMAIENVKNSYEILKFI